MIHLFTEKYCTLKAGMLMLQVVDFCYTWFAMFLPMSIGFLKIHHVQARKEARLQAAHEAAIFGTPVVLEGTDAKGRPSRRERESSDSFGGDDDGDENDNGTGAAKVSGVVSEQVW